MKRPMIWLVTSLARCQVIGCAPLPSVVLPQTDVPGKWQRLYDEQLDTVIAVSFPQLGMESGRTGHDSELFSRFRITQALGCSGNRLLS